MANDPGGVAALTDRPRPPAPAAQQALGARPTRRRRRVGMRVMEADRPPTPADPGVRAGIERHLAWLDQEGGAAGRLLAEAVAASPAWRAKDDPLRGPPGAGPVVSRALPAARRAGRLRDSADRLRARGKEAKVALIAVARKLLVIANAALRTGQPWQPALAAAR